jgi:hypothetical protein
MEGELHSKPSRGILSAISMMMIPSQAALWGHGKAGGAGLASPFIDEPKWHKKQIVTPRRQIWI